MTVGGEASLYLPEAPLLVDVEGITFQVKPEHVWVNLSRLSGTYMIRVS